MRFLVILVVFKLGSGQISFNLVEKAIAIQQLTLYAILAWVCKDLCLEAFHFFDFFCLSSFAAIIDLLLGLLVVKKPLRKCH